MRCFNKGGSHDPRHLPGKAERIERENMLMRVQEAVVTGRKKKVLTAERVRELLNYSHDTGVITWRVDKGPKRAGCEAGGSMALDTF